MTRSRKTLAGCLLGVVSVIAVPVTFGQDAPPDQPFKALHLVTLPQGIAETTFLEALTDVNQAIAKAGCEACIYHLYKVYGKQAGAHAYIRESAWPGRAVYEKIHADAGYTAANKRHPELKKVAETE